MQQFRIAVYPGDGIGPEVIDQAVRVLHAVEQIDGNFACELASFPWGVAHWQQTGKVVPGDFLDILRRYDAILLDSDVAAQRQHCDAAVMNFVRCPEQFDVVVASNLFGDPVEPRERLYRFYYAGKLLIDVHRVQQRLIAVGLELLCDDQNR